MGVNILLNRNLPGKATHSEKIVKELANNETFTFTSSLADIFYSNGGVWRQ
jgi:hypothetical protein